MFTRFCFVGHTHLNCTIICIINCRYLFNILFTLSNLVATVKLNTGIYGQCKLILIMTPQDHHNNIKIVVGYPTGQHKLSNIYTPYFCEISIATGQYFVTVWPANYSISH